MEGICGVLKGATGIYKRSLLFEGAFSRWTIAVLAFTIFISLTLAGWSLVQDLEERNENTRFDNVVAEAIHKIKHHFSGYEQVLKGGLGHLLAS